MARLLDLLVPGDEVWPSASVALAGVEAVTQGLDPAPRAWLQRQADRLATLPDTDQIEALRTLERAEPELFAGVLQALYVAYYSTGAVQAVIGRLAAAGPREPSPMFDTGLLNAVIASQRGRRRL